MLSRLHEAARRVEGVEQKLLLIHGELLDVSGDWENYGEEEARRYMPMWLSMFKDLPWNYTQIALKVLDSLTQREEERISSLFGDESDVSKVFSSFTHGDYTAVRYIPDKQAIEVDRRDGITLEPWKLSGGTYDQLYLAIRVALAKQVLGEDQGFFLFDDPFVKSDPVRLRVQITNLWELVQNGWQIIYFSTKPEVREELNNLFNPNDFQLMELPPAPFKQDLSS